MGAQLTLEQIADMARRHSSSPEETRKQRVSLIMGVRSAKSNLTVEKVSGLLADIEGHPETAVTSERAG